FLDPFRGTAKDHREDGRKAKGGFAPPHQPYISILADCRGETGYSRRNSISKRLNSLREIRLAKGLDRFNSAINQPSSSRIAISVGVLGSLNVRVAQQLRLFWG